MEPTQEQITEALNDVASGLQQCMDMGSDFGYEVISHDEEDSTSIIEVQSYPDDPKGPTDYAVIGHLKVSFIPTTQE